mmetsp:Transcript_86153/g.217083  ORF Transcript_86153/g.217083 Transcript_86153/m.217083 type:complete len:238 (+) Transcript_86153:193-906(+)
MSKSAAGSTCPIVNRGRRVPRARCGARSPSSAGHLRQFVHHPGRRRYSGRLPVATSRTAHPRRNFQRDTGRRLTGRGSVTRVSLARLAPIAASTATSAALSWCCRAAELRRLQRRPCSRSATRRARSGRVRKWRNAATRQILRGVTGGRCLGGRVLLVTQAEPKRHAGPRCNASRSRRCQVACHCSHACRSPSLAARSTRRIARAADRLTAPARFAASRRSRALLASRFAPKETRIL